MYVEGLTRNFNFEEANLHAKHRIRNIHTKYNINFNFEVENLYNLKILVVSIIIKLVFFGNFGITQHPLKSIFSYVLVKVFHLTESSYQVVINR